jgi:hypothetical protein
MAISEELIRELAVLSQTRAPVWQTGGPAKAATKPPANSGEMLSMTLAAQGGLATRALLEVLLRENSSYRSALASLVYVAATTYRITIDGEDHDQVADTDKATTAQNLADDINAGRTGAGTETVYGKARADVGTYDAATTYTMTINGIAHDALAAGSDSATATALMNAINQGSQADYVTASIDPGDNTQVVVLNDTNRSYTMAVSASGGTGTITFAVMPATASLDSNDDIVIVGTAEENYTFDTSITAGNGTISHTVDATQVSFVVWGLATGRTVPVQLSWTELTVTKNGTERLDLGPYTYAQVQITETDGNVSWALGKADLES